MAKVLICDKCQGTTGQRDFDHFVIYRDEAHTGKQTECIKLDLCPQCGVEFREWYRFAWSGPVAVPIAVARG